MNPALLNFLSGPINALIRYGVTAAAGAVVSKGWLDAGTTGQVAAAVIGLAAAGIGALTSTKAAKITTTAMLPGVEGVMRSDGITVFHKGGEGGPMESRYPPAPMTDR